jgi:hypothetical protein
MFGDFFNSDERRLIFSYQFLTPLRLMTAARERNKVVI